MVHAQRQSGFSLTEVLLAAAILSIGMVLIAMVFPVGVKLTTLATERSIGAIASNEAFAKIRLYGVPVAALQVGQAKDFLNVLTMPYLPANLNNECVYPSVLTHTEKRYHWSALCWKVNPDKVKTVVFVNRAMTGNALYYNPMTGNQDNLWPVPVKLKVAAVAANSRQILLDAANDAVFQPAGTKQAWQFLNDAVQIVDDSTGDIYTVFENDKQPAPATKFTLDKKWTGGITGFVWVVPPAVGSTRYPCMGIYPFKEF